MRLHVCLDICKCWTWDLEQDWLVSLSRLETPSEDGRQLESIVDAEQYHVRSALIAGPCGATTQDLKGAITTAGAGSTGRVELDLCGASSAAP